MNIIFNKDHLEGYIDETDYEKIFPRIEKAHHDLENGTGQGSEFTGWLRLPTETEDAFLDELTDFGNSVREHTDCLVSIGIGGSYLGIHASLEFLVADQKIPVYYAGSNLSAGYMYHLINMIKDKRVTVVVISKSGTTTEPALAFRILKKFMQEKYGPEELKKRIVCITDKKRGALRAIAEREGYRSFPINDDVGGRFSVLTTVGLVPLSIAGIDIKKLIEGARLAQGYCSTLDMDKNIAYMYAASRYLLLQQGKEIEVLSTFYQRLSLIEEWWKQLFGESEGKNGKGLFPTSVSFTSDLHSMGQLLQEGKRNMFETFLLANESDHEMIIPSEEEDLDNFNCVAEKDLDFVNQKAYQATSIAHFEGGVPNMSVKIPAFNAHSLGQLYYFFEKAVAITGYLMEVNPFNQPGVEAYKIKMFELLGRS